MLVVLYALAGTVNIDFSVDPISNDKNGNPVFLRDLWPSANDIESMIDSSLNSKNVY